MMFILSSALKTDYEKNIQGEQWWSISSSWFCIILPFLLLPLLLLKWLAREKLSENQRNSGWFLQMRTEQVERSIGDLDPKILPTFIKMIVCLVETALSRKYISIGGLSVRVPYLSNTHRSAIISEAVSLDLTHFYETWTLSGNSNQTALEVSSIFSKVHLSLKLHASCQS